MAKDSELSDLTETNGQKQIAMTYQCMFVKNIIIFFQASVLSEQFVRFVK